MDADLDEVGARILKGTHELDADHAGGLLEPHAVERRPSHHAEVAVGIAHAEPEGEGYEPVVDAADRATRDVVGSVELVALHDVDAVGCLRDEELELGGIVLAVTVGVEDPLLGRGAEAREQRAAVAAVVLVGVDLQARLGSVRCLSTRSDPSLEPSLTTM